MALLCDLAAALVAALALELAARLFAGEWKLGAPSQGALLAVQLAAQLGVAAALWPARIALALTSRFRWALLLVLVALPSWFWARPLFDALTSGEWVRQQSFAGTARQLGPIAMAAGVFVIAYAFLAARWLEQGKARWVRGATAFALALVFTWANVKLLPGLYPEAHIALVAIAALLAQLSLRDAAAVLLEARLASPRARVASALALALALVGFVGLSLPPGRATLTEIILRSRRSSYVFQALFKLPATALRDHLAHLKLDKKDPTPPSESGTLVLPADTNVILAVVDTLRADTLPPAREQRPNRRFTAADTPNLTAFVERSFRFTRAYAQATMTRVSMFSLMRSWDGFQWSGKGGEFLASVMSGLGRYPIAIVPEYFNDRDHVRNIFDDFARVEVYPRGKQERQRELISQALSSSASRPFFAWLHYYAVHGPGYDGQLMADGDAAWPDNYPKALRWLDGEFGFLFEELKKLGIADRTVVVLTADHGEGLGDKGIMSHGPSVADEVSRVPLAIYVPGQKGRLIDATVGNIDVAPTLNDLLGGKPVPSHRGTSLVPLLTRPERTWDRSYFVQGEHEVTLALIQQDRKHIYNPPTRVHLEFNLDRDPAESTTLFRHKRPESLELLGQMVERHPRLFQRELKTRPAGKLLDKRLAQISAGSTRPAVSFLMDLVKLRPTPERLAAVQRAFELVEDPQVKALIAARFFDPEKPQEGLGGALERHLCGLQGRPEQERSLVLAMAANEQQAFAPQCISTRFAAASEKAKEDWLPWLQLISNWPLKRPGYAQGLARVLTTLLQETPRDLPSLRLALRAARDLRTSPELAQPVAQQLELALAEPDPGVQALALEALAKVGGADAEALLRSRLDPTRPALVRVAALEGLVKLLGDGALADLQRVGKEPELSVTALRALQQLKSEQARAALAELSRASNGRPYLEQLTKQAQRAQTVKPEPGRRSDR